VRLMLAAKRAEFLELDPLGGGLLVLGAAVVFSLALGTLKSDNFAHCCSLSVAVVGCRPWESLFLHPTTYALQPIPISP